MIKDYGKHVFTDKDGNLWVAQPKSFTKANERGNYLASYSLESMF